ncbi:hypothetical protein [Luteimonas fraxinea]|uniref:Uncharacterized protein n=1 Tax=Luteimonas fraxinea TaxID=2901869 RepID=A0ABS8U9I3_9GAMM|nr:hypothetical protein [Luteimonas fraxinea]MCD9096156.1 hypothetical protein [Luteimonas fraxinea]
MSEYEKLDMLFAALGVLYVATWLLLSGWAAVALGDAVREHGGSRRAAKVTTRVMFLLLGVGGSVVIQAVFL